MRVVPLFRGDLEESIYPSQEGGSTKPGSARRESFFGEGTRRHPKSLMISCSFFSADARPASMSWSIRLKSAQ